MTPKPRFITKPGCTCVCKDCGAPLELACPNGHNPGQYILSVDAQDVAARSPAPKGKERKIRIIPSPTGLCKDCDEVFDHAKKQGRRNTRCPKCRGVEA